MEKTIVIIGDSYIGYNDVQKTFKSTGLEDYKIEMHTDYKKLKKLNFEKYKYNSNYTAIFIGPVPHSVHSKNNSSSIITEMENDKGYPLVVRLSANKSLKITNYSIKCGIEKLKGKVS